MCFKMKPIFIVPSDKSYVKEGANKILDGKDYHSHAEILSICIISCGSKCGWRSSERAGNYVGIGSTCYAVRIMVIVLSNTTAIRTRWLQDSILWTQELFLSCIAILSDISPGFPALFFLYLSLNVYVLTVLVFKSKERGQSCGWVVKFVHSALVAEGFTISDRSTFWHMHMPHFNIEIRRLSCLIFNCLNKIQEACCELYLMSMELIQPNEVVIWKPNLGWCRSKLYGR